MENILFVLLPGIAGYYVYTTVFKSIPKEKEYLELVKVYSILTFLSLIIFGFFITLTTEFTLETDMVTLSNELLENIIIGDTIILLLLVVFIPPLILGLILNLGKTSNGATIYVKTLEKKIIYKTECKRVKRKYFFGSKCIHKNSYRPVIFYKNNVEIERGKLLSSYTLPWEFKDLLIATRKNSELFDDDDLKLYTYYDAENDIKIEVYQHIDERRINNEDTKKPEQSEQPE